MDLEQRDRLSELVEELTTSGEPQLSQDKMKEVKKICKGSNDYIEHAYRSLMSQLNQEHAEIRLSAFQMATELFSRSHHFRTLLVDNFQEFLELTVETDSEQPLPPPKEVAKKLKSLAVQTVQSWQASYGSAYKKLALGYHFLKQVKKVDFHDVEARTLAERRREEERQRKMERIYGERVEKAAKEMEESRQEIEETLTEMDTCMKLLLADSFDPSDLQVTDRSPQHRQTPDSTQLALSAGDTSATSTNPNTRTDEGNSSDRRDRGRGDKSKKGKGVEKDGEKHTAVEGEEEEEEERRMDGAMQRQEVADEASFIRNSGLISHCYSLDINLEPDIHVKETEDNEAVVSTVRDLHRLITTKHLPAVQSWVQLFSKSGLEQQLLRRALDLKKCLEAAVQKHNELHIEYKKRRRRVMKASAVEGDDDDDDDTDDDDDFEEVPEKEGFEPHIPEHLREEYGLEPSASTSTAPPPRRKPAPPPPSSSSSASIHRKLKRALEEEQDPTRASATLRLLRQRLPQDAGPSTSTPGSSEEVRGESSSRQDVPDAPVVPFGLDLFYWGGEQPSAGKIIRSAAQHQFWVPCDEEGQEVKNEELEAESRSRFISFPGRFTPVGHHCHAPLANGTLCQRQDRLKCPFHGTIIPRDAQGRPIRAEDRQQEEKRKREEQPDWRDPELMRDIEAATGEDLGSDKVFGRGKGRGKGKGKKKKYPNLSDLKKSANTSRSRLEKKVFDKSSMKRVTAVMNKLDSRKHDKFSNQFNYALK